jgi:hypothetical protein
LIVTDDFMTSKLTSKIFSSDDFNLTCILILESAKEKTKMLWSDKVFCCVKT